MDVTDVQVDDSAFAANKTRTSQGSISLTSLNDEVQKKVKKFNTTNDGELTLEQAVQGLITLQKQSNNYKKMVWFLIPVLIGLIAATFGTTMLAFKINQQTQVSGSSLVSMDGSTVRTAQAHATDGNLFDITFSADFENIDYLQSNHFKVRVDSIIQVLNAQQEIEKVLVSTRMFTMTLYRDGSVDVTANPGFANSAEVQAFTGIMTLAAQRVVVDPQTGMKTVVDANANAMKPFVGQTTLVCPNARPVGCVVYVYYKCGNAWCTRRR